MTKKSTTPNRKKFTAKFDVSSSALINSVINSAGVVSIPDETRNNPVVNPVGMDSQQQEGKGGITEEKVMNLKRKKFTSSNFDVSSSSLINSVINAAGVVPVPDPDAGRKNPVVSPVALEAPKYSRDQRRRSFVHDRSGSMEVLVPVVITKKSSNTSRIRARRKSVDHFDHFDPVAAEEDEIADLQKRFGPGEKDHHENYNSKREEERQRSFVAGKKGSTTKRRERSKFHLPHKPHLPRHKQVREIK